MQTNVSFVAPLSALLRLSLLNLTLHMKTQRKMLCSSRFANKNTYVCRDLTLPHLPLKHRGFSHPVRKSKGSSRGQVAPTLEPGGMCSGQRYSVREARSQSPAPQGTPPLARQAGAASSQDVGSPPKGCLPHWGSPCQKRPMRTPSQRQADARTQKAKPVSQWGIRSWCFSWELLPPSCLLPHGPSRLSREPAPPPQPAPVNHLIRIPSSGSASKVPA